MEASAQATDPVALMGVADNSPLDQFPPAELLECVQPFAPKGVPKVESNGNVPQESLVIIRPRVPSCPLDSIK